MICNDKPRFKEILERANYILISSSNIQTFPFSVKKVIKEYTGIVCRTYEKAATYGVDINDFGSKDAICHKYNNRHIIFYNNASYILKERKRFSLGHELGHKIMEHDLDDKENYDLFEIESNFFCAQLLMPEQIINELRKRGKHISILNLQKWFGVSAQAAEKRLETLNKVDYLKRSEDERSMDKYIVDKFGAFIDNIAPPINEFEYYDPYEEEMMQNERDSWY